MPPWSTARYAVRGLWMAAVGVIVALAVGWGAINHVRLHGFHFLFLDREGALAKVERLEGEIAALVEAEKLATKRQQAVNDAAARIYAEVAERMDDEAEQASTAALDAADRYIAANRVPAEPCRSPGRADPPAADHGPAVPARVPGDSFVAVTDADLRACTAAASYAVSAHNWAIDLEQSSQAQQGD